MSVYNNKEIKDMLKLLANKEKSKSKWHTVLLAKVISVGIWLLVLGALVYTNVYVWSTIYHAFGK